MQNGRGGAASLTESGSGTSSPRLGRILAHPSLRSSLATRQSRCREISFRFSSPGRARLGFESLPIKTEGGGFEPPIPLQVWQFSRLLVSTAHAPFLKKKGTVPF